MVFSTMVESVLNVECLQILSKNMSSLFVMGVSQQGFRPVLSLRVLETFTDLKISLGFQFH